MGLFYEMKEVLAVEDGNLVIKRKKQLKKYGYPVVEMFISHMSRHGYECYQTWEGCLQDGNWILCPPEEGSYYVIREVADNEWSSHMTIQPKKRLSKADEAELAEFLERKER